MTAFYMFRLIYLTFWSPSRVACHEIEHHIHESPKSMTVAAGDPGVLLAHGGLVSAMALQAWGVRTISRNFLSRCSRIMKQSRHRLCLKKAPVGTGAAC